MAEQVMERLGRINILINNAGINTRSDRVPIHQYSLEDWNRIVQVDLTGVLCDQPYDYSGNSEEPRWRAHREHQLHCGFGALTVAELLYVAAKAGVANLTKSMAIELGAQGILVNAVAPGSTLTRGTEALFYGPDGAYTENAASLLSHIPLGRPGKVEEIAHAVLFLVSPGASYINGIVLAVDGGWTAGYVRDW